MGGIELLEIFLCFGGFTPLGEHICPCILQCLQEIGSAILSFAQGTGIDIFGGFIPFLSSEHGCPIKHHLDGDVIYIFKSANLLNNE